MKKNKQCIPEVYFIIILTGIASVIAFLFTARAQEIYKSYPVPLATLIPFFDAQTGKLDEVLITYGSQNEGWTISFRHDRYIKDRKRKSLEHTHKEMQHGAGLISAFEAEQISRVCNTLVKTLNGFEKDLERGNWDKCLYLDHKLCFFLRGFYYLINAARRSNDYLPKVCCIAETLYDESPDSPKSRRRIMMWRNMPDYVIKLRISIRELEFQIRQWQKKDLDNPNRDIWDDPSLKFIQAYELFIRYYFNFDPKPEVIRRR